MQGARWRKLQTIIQSHYIWEQTHRRMSKRAILHACPSFMLFPSVPFLQTSSLHRPLVELGVATDGPRRGCQLWEGLLSSHPVLHVPVLCSPSPCRSLCSLYAWVSFQRISTLEWHDMQAHILPACCQDTGRDCPGVGLWSTPQRSCSIDTAAEAEEMMSIKGRLDPGS